ncbi:eCIS core domain-containing protein [Spongiimicrobium salis]|uniref:eCIS core domain-containing protein n=1 Tax=Spongiimicrobium salis TaxID=1667022 RepID=UPI00374D4D10
MNVIYAKKRSMGTAGQKQQWDRAHFQFMDNRPEALQTVQLQGIMEESNAKTFQPIQKKKNSTGLPDALKSGIENLSGYTMDDVKVHYNSSKPAQLQAHAYAQGTDIHLGAGQEKHLPHEAWHVVQQKQGRVRPTRQLKGKIQINDDAGLEKEADVMGAKAWQKGESNSALPLKGGIKLGGGGYRIAQRMPKDFDLLTAKQIGRQIVVMLKEASKWNTIEGVINQWDKTTGILKIGDKEFSKDEVNSTNFKIVTMPHKHTDGETDWDIDAARPADPWSELDPDHKSALAPTDFEEKKELLQLIKEVVALVETLPTELQALMPHDTHYNMTPEGQLEYCVEICKGKDIGVLAKSLYTTYFYKPINNFLRKKLPAGIDKKVMALIESTVKALHDSLAKHGVLQDIDNQRVELQAEWMGDLKKDGVLDFPAFTSMHATGYGIESMKSDIGDDLFGEVTKLAVLNFKGKGKTLVPVEKYFTGEKEIVVAPGMRAKIIDVKDIQVDIPKKGKIPGKEYTLEILEA